jgi:iron complex transport system substrate-binding protein
MKYFIVLSVLISFASKAESLGPPLRKEISRVVTVAPSLTESVMALGKTGVLVGVSRFDEAAEVSSLTRVGGFTDPSVEIIVSLKPHVVFVQKSPGNQKSVETLVRLGISVVAFELNTLAQVESSMLEMGTILGAQESAQKFVSDFTALREQLKSKVKTKKKSALFVVGFSPLVVAGKNSFPDELMAICGVENAVTSGASAWPLYSMEKAATLKPAILIDASDVATGRESVQKIKSFKRAQWISLTDKSVLHPGPGLLKALPELCSKL